MMTTSDESAGEGLVGTIDRFEEKFAVITTSDGQTVRWPIKNLPDDCVQGSMVRLVLKTSGSEQAEREQLAKTVLNEILRGDEGKKS